GAGPDDRRGGPQEGAPWPGGEQAEARLADRQDRARGAGEQGQQGGAAAVLRPEPGAPDPAVHERGDARHQEPRGGARPVGQGPGTVAGRPQPARGAGGLPDDGRPVAPEQALGRQRGAARRQRAAGGGVGDHRGDDDLGVHQGQGGGGRVLFAVHAAAAAGAGAAADLPGLAEQAGAAVGGAGGGGGAAGHRVADAETAEAGLTPYR